MSSDVDRQAASFVAGLCLGAVIGAGVAFLTTPHSGRRTRKRFRRAAHRFRGRAEDQIDELAADVRWRVDDAYQSARERFVD